MSFIVTPTLMVTCIDRDADISFVFALIEEETKESKEKGTLDSDEVFQKSYFPLVAFNGLEINQAFTFFEKVLNDLYCPGEIAPPPELS